MGAREKRQSPPSGVLSLMGTQANKPLPWRNCRSDRQERTAEKSPGSHCHCGVLWAPGPLVWAAAVRETSIGEVGRIGGESRGLPLRPGQPCKARPPPRMAFPLFHPRTPQDSVLAGLSYDCAEGGFWASLSPYTDVQVTWPPGGFWIRCTWV